MWHRHFRLCQRSDTSAALNHMPLEENEMMKVPTIVAAATLALAFAAPMPSFAQTQFPGAIYVAPDHSMSAKSLIGVMVYNDQHDKIGTIETVMVPPSGGAATAVLSVGDYLGTGKKMVGVPLSHLQLEGKDTMMMAGATKSMLESLPAYNTGGG
jgi:PRC-barrel domain